MSSDGNKVKVQLRKEDLEKLLQLEFGPDLKVLSFTSKPLTKPGDNLGSTMLSVEVLYSMTENNEPHLLPIVAKLVPESPFLCKLFHIEVTFNKEVRAYTVISPEFLKLQKEKNIPESEMLDIFSKYYGSKSNKQNDINMEADETAVLLMENLRLSGYEVGDRRKGLNLEHMEFSIIKLAQFHALGVVLKILKPQLFKESILKTCENFMTDRSDEESENWILGTVELIKSVPECIPYTENIEKSLRAEVKLRKERSEPLPREPFATIVHNDFWVNNMMFKYNKCGNEDYGAKLHQVPIAMKFLDFQITIYDSPVRDLLFFTFTSSEDGLIEKHFDELVKLYHRKFVELLTKFHCDIEPFSYKNFEEEMNSIAPREFPHILHLLNPICARSEGTEKHSEVTQDSLYQNRGGAVYTNRVGCFVQMYMNRRWL